jgi:exodeoxyribonuclease VII small subunit
MSRNGELNPIETVANEGAAPAEPSFEDAMRELDAIVERMENGTLSLEQSLAAYRRGAELVRHCQTRLDAVRQQVQMLDGEILRPLSDLGE